MNKFQKTQAGFIACLSLLIWEIMETDLIDPTGASSFSQWGSGDNLCIACFIEVLEDSVGSLEHLAF
ncbi:hypothetical protein [Facklamia hominis]|uniref:hypothetical protein n=1 Tax=Facklamia hominis TaxID=178214 RepID=UPI00101C9746|nr:hypothetical protein [Facklamia hominis]RYC97664.1 hypothetical protein EKN08_07210 [Facklamia hominis]WPJ90543.1 hypothetical protein R0V13_08635 [Facklamia hominis]